MEKELSKSQQILENMPRKEIKVKQNEKIIKIQDEYSKFYTVVEDAIQCHVCPHKCLIKKGRAGVCGVRYHTEEGNIKLLNYGRSMALNIDPMEKKPLYHFYPGSKIISLGTLGCNLRCHNCQNYDISQMFDAKAKIQNYNHLESWGQQVSPKEIVSAAKQNNVKFLAFTYNEPTIQFEYSLDTMKLAKKEGIKNVWVTNGYTSKEVLEAIIPYLDAANVDIKSFDQKFYSQYTGSKLQYVLETCKTYFKQNVWLELTTLVIPTLSDQPAMLKQIAHFIKTELSDEVPWHLSAFSGEISWKLQHLPQTSEETIIKAVQIGKEYGLKYVYGGNVLNQELNNTYCHNCSNLLVNRQGYFITNYMDKPGICNKCQIKIPGRYE